MHASVSSHLAAQCGICGTILSGAASVVYRTFGIRRSPRNPNICTRCSTHVEEGRVVEITVLFADLSSFTELTQELGAEKTHEVVDAYLRMATDVLVKHGAFIDKYVGDAVMALFNVALRHEDHARRAIAAAMELESEIKNLGNNFGLTLRVSVGIATGHARVGRLGSDDSKDFTAIILKGFREPVTAYRLQGAGIHPLVNDVADGSGRQSTSLGAIVFGILGAPCAVATLIGPLAVALGAGSLFGLAGALTFLDQSALRIPILVLAALAALANLYTLWRARKLRAESKIPEHLKTMTSLEKRQTVFVLSAAIATLGIVVFEVVAHAIMH
jgi:adenylate cyclase